MREIKIPIILSSLAFGAMSFLLPVYSHEMNMNAIEIGGVFSIFSLTVVLIRPLIGRLADRRGYKPLFVIGLLFYALAFWVLADIRNIWGLYTGRVMQALASCLMGVSTYGIVIGKTTEGNVARSLGKITEWGTQGSLIGSMICFWILSRMNLMEGWRNLFIFYGVGAILAMIISLIKVESIYKGRKKTSRTALKLIPEVIKLLIITFGTAIISSMLGPMLMIYLQDHYTKDLRLLALAFIPSTIVYSTLSSEFGRFSDKYGRIKGMSIGLLISGSAILLIPSTSSLVFLSLLWCVDAIGGLISGTAEDAFFYELVGADRLGEMYGVYRMVGGIGTAIGPLMGGLIYEGISGQLVFYLEGIGFIVVAGVIIILLGKTQLASGGKCGDENICERR